MARRASSRSAERAVHDWEDLLREVPGYDPWALAGDCRFDAADADRAVGFIESCLVHVEGAKAGQPFLLERWQKAIMGNLFGWKRRDGTRRYRECFIFVPRKSGKSLMAGAIAAYTFFCDGEPGAKVYCAAAERDQAKLVWDVVKRQVQKEPVLAKACQVYQHHITIEESGSYFKAISADAKTKHGFNAHCVVVDELHAQPDAELVDALVTSMGARRQPLVVYITTADYERESVCNDTYRRACEVRDNPGDPLRPGYDPAFLPVIYEAGKDEDWTAEAVWRKANPNLGVSISLDYMREKCRRAKEDVSFTNTFRRLHLNTRTETATAYFDMAAWDRCGAPFDPASLKGKRCFAGGDLGETTDLTAFVLYFPEGHYLLPFFWVPEEAARVRERRNDPYYRRWARSGHLNLTAGNVLDYRHVLAEVQRLSKEYAIQEVGLDLFNSRQLVQQFQEIGLKCTEVRTGMLSMNEPTRRLSDLVNTGVLRHGGHPVLRWNAANTKVETDKHNNVCPVKPKGWAKIDGIVASAIALGCALFAPKPKPRPEYRCIVLDDRGWIEIDGVRQYPSK